MAAARALGVEGVDGAALERLDRVLDEARFVERIGVDHHLHVVIVGDRKAAVDRGRRRAPVLVQFERAGAGLDLLDQRGGLGGVALAGEAEVHRIGVGGLDHALDVPGAGRAGGGEGAGRGPVPPPSIEVTPDISASSICCGQMKWMWVSKPPAVRILPSPAITSVPGPDDDGDAGLDVGIAGLADGGDEPVLQADVGFDDPPMVEDDGVGDDGVDGAPRVGGLRLPHAVADHLAAAELHLLAVSGEILLDFDHELGVGEADAVAGRGAEHLGVMGARQGGRGEDVAGRGHQALSQQEECQGSPR